MAAFSILSVMAMQEFQQGNQYFIFNQDCSFEPKSSFFEPSFWQQQGRVLGAAKGRGTTYFVSAQDYFGCDCALRHYYRGGLWGKFNRDRYRLGALAQTRSFAEFRLLHQLHTAGLAVPKPIAARVTIGRLGICYQADILLEKLQDGEDLCAYLVRNNLNGTEWQRIGGLIRQMHDLQVCHTDLNAHNIFVQEKGEKQYWLLDFDKCGLQPGEHWKSNNLERLHRSFLKEVGRMGIHFTEADWQQLKSGYQG